MNDAEKRPHNQVVSPPAPVDTPLPVVLPPPAPVDTPSPTVLPPPVPVDTPAPTVEAVPPPVPTALGSRRLLRESDISKQAQTLQSEGAQLGKSHLSQLCRLSIA